MFSSSSKKIVTAFLLTSCCCADIGWAQTTWLPVVEQSSKKEQPENEVTPVSDWEWIPPSKESPSDLVWEPLMSEPNNSAPDADVWSAPDDRHQTEPLKAANEKNDADEAERIVDLMTKTIKQMKRLRATSGAGYI